MTNVEKSSGLFDKGYNCAQSIMGSYGARFFKSEEHAIRLASAFNAGILYGGNICGAVSGSLMSIGLIWGENISDNDTAKEIIHHISREFVAGFMNEYGTISCSKLLGFNPGTPEGIDAARQAGVFNTICPGAVRKASMLIDELLLKYPPARIRE